MADMQQIEKYIDGAYVEFDRGLFVEEILNNEFNGSISECAKAMNMNKAYLHDLIYITSNKAGKINLTRLFRYCVKNGKDPLRYITKIIK